MKENHFYSPEKDDFFSSLLLKDIVITALLGVALGVVVSLLLWSIGLGESVNKGPLGTRLFLLPGALFLCLFTETWFYPGISGHGMENLRWLYQKNRSFPSLAWLVKGLRTLVTLGCGGSGGTVGPMAYVGASFFTSFQRAYPFKEALFCGAVGGVAVVLGTPLAATLFVMESLGEPLFLRFSPKRCFRGFWCGLWASWSASGLGLVPRFNLAPYIPPFDMAFLFYVFVGGIFFGILSICHIMILRYSRRGIRLVGKNPLALAIVGGGLLLLLYHTQGLELAGTSQGTLYTYLQGHGSSSLFQGLWKSLVTGITVGAGGSGGMVGPTFYVGALGGTTFAHFFSLSPSVFALLGAAGVLSGAANAPVAAMAFLVEICGFNAFIPGVVLCGTAYVVGRKWHLFDHHDPSDFL